MAAPAISASAAVTSRSSGPAPAARTCASHTSLTVKAESGGDWTLSPPAKRPVLVCAARRARRWVVVAATAQPLPCSAESGER
ncbi:hypothetical protein QF037_001250 [Streptomyces canus]|nr:hypothetical protein [Streptomyces canus]